MLGKFYFYSLLKVLNSPFAKTQSLSFIKHALFLRNLFYYFLSEMRVTYCAFLKKQISVDSVDSVNGHIYILYCTILFAEKNKNFRLHLILLSDFSCPYCFWFFFNTILIVIHFQVPALPLLSLPWGISCSLRYYWKKKQRQYSVFLLKTILVSLEYIEDGKI